MCSVALYCYILYPFSINFHMYNTHMHAYVHTFCVRTWTSVSLSISGTGHQHPRPVSFPCSSIFYKELNNHCGAANSFFASCVVLHYYMLTCIDIILIKTHQLDAVEIH